MASGLCERWTAVLSESRASGVIPEHWGVCDALKMMQLLGAIPGPPPA
jgi:hypothetical protein